LYLNITGTIFLAGAFASVVGGLYWPRANLFGGYLAMIAGAAGAIVPFFFLHWNETVVGFGSFALAAAGLVVGSLLRKPSGAQLEHSFARRRKP